MHPAAHPYAPRNTAARAGWSLIETMACLVIISVVSAMAVVNTDSQDVSSRLDRAAQEIVSALRYARMEAMGHGQTLGATTQPTDLFYGVQFDTDANTVTVYSTTWNSSTSTWTLPGTAMTGSDLIYAGGKYIINFNTDPDVQGVTITSVHLVGTSDTLANTVSPYVCQYKPFGEAENYGSATAAITISYAGSTRTISIPQIGDAYEN